MDVLARAKFRGKEAFFLIHVENQSTRQQDFPKRMFRYFARLHEKFDLPVYPVALFSWGRPTRPERGEYRVSFPDKEVLAFAFRVIQLNRLSWADFVKRPNPVAAALMAKMRIAPKDRAKVKFQCLRLMTKLHLDRARDALIWEFVKSYLALNAAEQARFYEQIEKIPPKERKVVMKVVNSFVEEGRQQLALQVIERRFPALPLPLRSQIMRLSGSELVDLIEALPVMENPSEIKVWLAERRKVAAANKQRRP